MKIVYISEHLGRDVEKGEKYGWKVAEELQKLDKIQVAQIGNHSKNVWCRDYMPVKYGENKYVQFIYHPSYMNGIAKYQNNFPDASLIHQELGLDCRPSNIILDGGAVEVCRNKAIVSDRVFRDNKESVSAVYAKIKKILELNDLIVIPQYPYDFTGHVDGLVRFVDSKRVVVNNVEEELKVVEKEGPYRKKLIENWRYAFESALISAGLRMEDLPTSTPENAPYKSGEGIYTNFLLLDNLILMPTYTNEIALKSVNAAAARKLKECYGREVIPIDATELSKMGGMINCVTWTR